eukprot:SAG11_NODE_25972_length_351_cov_1.011905_1_plen_94_part_10
MLRRMLMENLAFCRHYIGRLDIRVDFLTTPRAEVETAFESVAASTGSIVSSRFSDLADGWIGSTFFPWPCLPASVDKKTIRDKRHYHTTYYDAS